MISDRYRIKRPINDFLAPEETFIDGLSDHVSMELPVGRNSFRLFFLLFTLVAGAFLMKAFQLQILNGKKYAQLANKNNFSKYGVLALRGIIYDTNSQPVVENIPILDVIGVTQELPRDIDKRRQLSEDLGLILNMMPKELSAVFDKNINATTFLIKNDISKEEVIKIQILKQEGVYTAAGTQRRYLNGNSMAHILGYTAKVNPEDLKSDPYYLLNDRIGRLGLENQYEEELRGDHNKVLLGATNNQPNTILRTGNNLVLTLSSIVQKKLYSVMSSVLYQNNLSRGAAVVQNVRTGAILAIVSFPSFDSNVFETSSSQSSINKISQILNDKNQPLFNRAINGRYSPGSTIKPLLALAGLQEKVVTEKTTVFSSGSISVPSIYDPNVIYTFRDWKAHGLSDIRKAIADSVDIYFYALGGGYEKIAGLGIDRIIKYYKQFRIDQRTGIDLPGEVSGFIPSPEWKSKTKNEPWYIGDTFNVSIGQGDLSVTPIWLTSYIAALANGGSFMKPYLVREIRDSDDKVIKEIAPKELTKIDLDPDARRIVLEGMRQTVTNGTAKLLQEVPVALAAKTGTAQVGSGKDLNSLFSVYGPYNNPEIAVTVLIEDITKSQSLAVEIAKEFLLWYFSERTQTSPAP